jgi:Ni/Co efflux regulator RcnB
MTRFIPALIALGFVAAAFAAPAIASAKVIKHPIHHRVAHVVAYNDPRPPLTVNRRSWLDPGPVVPQYSEQRYVQAATIFNQTPDQMYLTDKFGNDLLPRRFDPPGRPEPVVEFWTPRGY